MATNDDRIREAAERALTYGLGMLKVEVVDPYKNRRWLCRLGFHVWETHQHNFDASDTRGVVAVIAWKQCPHCGGSKLIHILR